MTENSVPVSIIINVGNEEIQYRKEVVVSELEEFVQGIAAEIGQQVFKASIRELDNRMEAVVPKTWRNAGTEERWMISSVGQVRYKRRVYVDEHRHRRKPVDELLGMKRYDRVSVRVQEMGSYLACNGTYRHAADQLSWMIKTPISHSAIQRMAWTIGNRIADGEEAQRKRIFEHGEQQEPGKIAAPVLYGESDGVWVHLQREKRRSAEVRVAILSTGRKQIGKDRFRLEHKHCVTAIGLNSEMWQEQVLREAHLCYDLERTKLLISGGDGNQWVRHTFDRLQIQQEFFLDRFHLQRAAKRAFRDWEAAKDCVTRLRQQGFDSVESDLSKLIQQSCGRREEKLKDFYRYVHHNQDGLLDMEYRGYPFPAHLGAIEGNVDKLVVHRMKGRGCSWRLPGVRAMLALCRNADQLRYHAYRYLPLQSPINPYRRLPNLEVKYSEVLQYAMPVFQGPHQNKPWVRSLHYLIHGR
jgi:hypothetical protein